MIRENLFVRMQNMISSIWKVNMVQIPTMSKGKSKLAIRYAKRIIKDGQGISDDPQILNTGSNLAADNGCLQYRRQDVRGELQRDFRISGIIRLLSAVLYDDGLCLNVQRRRFYIFQFILWKKNTIK